MSLSKFKTFALILIATAAVSACNYLPATQSASSENIPNSQDNILNLLEPDIKTEEQAFAKAEAVFREGKTENALFYYIKTLQYNKNNIKAMERIAVIYNRTNQPDLAIKIYQDILAADANNELANESLGLYCLKNGQTAKAKSHLGTVVKNNARNWKAQNGLGVIADLEHQYNDAISHYETALAAEPANPMLLNNLGYSNYLAGNPIKAKYLFTQALSYDNKYERAIHNLALIEIKNGNFTTATALFNRIMTAHESYNNIGYISMLNGQYAAAEEYLRRAIDESPVYFPKAQDNLKSLLSLKSKATANEIPSASTSSPAPAVAASAAPNQIPARNRDTRSNKPSTPAKKAAKKVKAITKKTTDATMPKAAEIEDGLIRPAKTEADNSDKSVAPASLEAPKTGNFQSQSSGEQPQPPLPPDPPSQDKFEKVTPGTGPSIIVNKAEVTATSQANPEKLKNNPETAKEATAPREINTDSAPEIQNVLQKATTSSH